MVRNGLLKVPCISVMITILRCLMVRREKNFIRNLALNLLIPLISSVSMYWQLSIDSEIV